MLKGISVPVEIFNRLQKIASERKSTKTNVTATFLNFALSEFDNNKEFEFKTMKKLREPVKTINEALKESPKEFADNFEEEPEEKSVIKITDLKKKTKKKSIKTMEELNEAELN